MLKDSRPILVVCGLLFAVISGPAGQARDREVPEYGRGYDAVVTSSGIAVDGKTLYMTWPSISCRNERWLVAVDIAAPAAPELLSKTSLPGFPQDLAIAGSCAYVVNGQDLLVVDIANPRSPHLLRTMAISKDPLRGPQGIEIAGTTAWLACRRDGVRAVDISRPESPRELGGCAIDGLVRDVTADGKRIYAALDTRGFAVIDAANARNPVILWQCETPTGTIGRIHIEEGVAYMAGGEDVVVCASLKDADRPTLAGASSDRHCLAPFFGAYSHDLALYRGDAGERFACAADGEGGLIITDVTDLGRPRFAGALMKGVRNGNPYRPTSIALDGRIAFLNDEAFGLRVVDISDPSNPALAGEGIGLR